MTKKDGLPEAAGRMVGAVLRFGPGVAGAVLVTIGLGMAWAPLGWIAAGVWLLLVDWRMP